MVISQIIDDESLSEQEILVEFEKDNNGVVICICGSPNIIAHKLISELSKQLRSINSIDIAPVELIEFISSVEVIKNDIPKCLLETYPRENIDYTELKKCQNGSHKKHYKTFFNTLSTFKMVSPKKSNFNKVHKIIHKSRSNC